MDTRRAWRETRRGAGAGLLLLVAACSGGGGPVPLPQAPGTLQLGAATASVGEAAGSIAITVTRTGGSAGAVSATLATAAGTATAGQDYGAVSVSVAFADGDTAAKTVQVAILNDAAVEGAEAFTIALSAPTGGATLGSPGSATITIVDDDAPPPPPGFGLDDTGVTGCSTAVATGLPCDDAAAGTSAFPRQDGQQGRDVTAPTGSDGRVGFSFRKLDAAGVPLLDQAQPYATTPWACLEDRVTGLTWEVATDDGGPRDRRWRFTWYDGAGLGAHHLLGVASGGTCADAISCDTEKHAAAARADRLCGFADWRLPARAELLSLVDGAFLPDAAAEPYWTGSTAWAGQAWTVDFATGGSRAERPAAARPVRLVRGGY